MFRLCLLWAAILLSVAVAPDPGLAQEGPVRFPISPEAIQVPKKLWYGVYSQGRKIGYAQSSLVREDSPIASRYVLEQAMTVKITAMGQKREIVSTDSFYFETKPPYSLIYAKHLEKDDVRESHRFKAKFLSKRSQ
jgi:hypothetical protein